MSIQAGREEVVVSIPLTRETPLPPSYPPIDIQPRPRSEFMQRAMNVTIALITLLVVSPILIVFALLVKLTSPGPIFYSQARVGLDRRRTPVRDMYDRRAQDIGGKPFMIYKFRTMKVNAEVPHSAVWATKMDARVTPVGRFMRKYRIDELPQLFNVLRGEMNIVGPRPERPSIFSQLCDDIEEYPLRQRAKPGITGWAQVNHNYDTCVEDVRKKVRYDLEYLERQSVTEDLRIMARTLPVMIL
ncbi:MAG TPA: sugar transferase, partial [Gemmatimonadaceae bacterium]|nr:sugar transferase [Gemmatimonadaceae bacterium]